MALTTDTLTREYRRQNLALRAVTTRDLLRLWPALDWKRLDATYPAWFAAVSLLVARDRGRAAALAGLYVQAFRSASGVTGEAPLLLAGPVDPDQLATAVRVTSVVAAKKAAIAGKPAALAMREAFVTSSGAVSRLVLDAGRDTIRQTTTADPASAGWQRVGSGHACSFCQLLIGRGSVYSEESADFQSHDHCGCSAEPVYR